MNLVLRLLLFVSLAIVGLPGASAHAEDSSPQIGAGSGKDRIWLSATKATESDRSNGISEHRTTIGLRTARPRYQPIRLAASVCRGLSALAVCGGTRPTCSMRARVIGGQLVGGGARNAGCTPARTPAVGAPPAAPPPVTPGVVLTALRRIGLPSLRARTQPEDKTLVNFATIFYTDPQSFTRTVTLLGQRVQIHATPASFTWHHGDGTSATTQHPGAPYPAKDVTHSYLDAHRTVQTSVDVTYTARFRVGGGGWQSIPGAVTIAGPSSPLRVSEATAVLSGTYR